MERRHSFLRVFLTSDLQHNSSAGRKINGDKQQIQKYLPDRDTVTQNLLRNISVNLHIQTQFLFL